MYFTKPFFVLIVGGMKPYKCFACTLMLFLAIAVPAYSDESSTLHLMFTKGPQSLSYTKQFETAVPIPMIHQIIDQFVQQLGKYRSVEGTSNPYKLVFEEGTVTAYITLDGSSNVAGLQFTEIISNRLTLSEAVNKIVDLDGETSVLIRKNGSVLFGHHADAPLAVGSAFKLGILAAVCDAIEAGRLQWSQSVALQPVWKSLPTGILQDWPEGTQVTVETLAALMISQSDNTATDALLHLVGKSAVERYLPGCKPVLSTVDMFKLKNPDNKDLLAGYRTASYAKRLAILEELKKRELPEPGLFSGNPVAIDIEWFVTAHELADLIERLQALDLMTINTGLATKQDWQRVAFKGGSEPGVLNLTTYLEDDQKNRYTVVVTVNNAEKPLDEKFIMETYQAILSLLAKDAGKSR